MLTKQVAYSCPVDTNMVITDEVIKLFFDKNIVIVFSRFKQNNKYNRTFY